MELTSSQEEYLKIIYIISKSKEEIRVTDIAKRLGITKPSVNRALKNLKEKKYLTYKTYGDIKMTQEGEKAAQEILKREDILKIFLIDILGISKEKAETEANVMKHVLSRETEEKLESYINKTLSLEELDCDYDENNEKCKSCIKIKARNRMRKEMKQNRKINKKEIQKL